jgi:tripeptide aminopeptidase
MPATLERIGQIVGTAESIKETILTNLVLIGQVPSPTFKEERRTQVFLERMADFQVDECTTDGFGNPVGIIRGTAIDKPPIFVVAHLDTYFDSDTDFNYRILENTIAGPGITDNSLGAAVLVSLPEIFRRLERRFSSDIVIAGVIQSMGQGNLRGVRHLLNTWPTPVRGAICVEGVELGRLNYYSDGMIRVEVGCHIGTGDGWEHPYRPNAILVLNEVINQVLQLRLPQRPRSRVIFGRFSGGLKHGIIAYDASLGMEIRSGDDQMVKTIYEDIRDIVHGTSHEYGVDLKLTTISNVNAATLRYNHPLVKAAGEIIHALGVKPISTSSESELSIFLSRKIPAITLGITLGEDYHLDTARLQITPIFKGIAQLVAAIEAIDNGVCDECPMD